jgi:hypothetical protein
MALPTDEYPEAFDEFEHSEQCAQTRDNLISKWARDVLKGVSMVALWIAFLTAISIVGLHAFRMIGGNTPAFLLTLKSAVPLIGIGLSYICLILAVPRTIPQRLLGFLVGVAFILWGAEQFMSNQGLASFIDDIVVFLFVLDLSLVVRKNLK